MTTDGKGSTLRKLTRLGVGAAALLGVIGLGAGAAYAAPSNAKNAITDGQFDCGSAGSGTFVINTGNANGTAWGTAHLTFADGSTANFHADSLNLTISGPGVPPGQNESKAKPNATGGVTCQINATQGPFTLAGTVTGTIVPNG